MTLSSVPLSRVPAGASTVQPPTFVRRWWGPMYAPLRHWQGRRVWLVGASSGIGLACAQALHAAGAQVIVSARRPREVLAWAARETRVHWHALDVTDAQAVAALAQQLSREGPLDLVVYCAGHYKPQRALQPDLQDWLRHDRINYQGALHVLNAVLPTLLSQQHGHISLVSSVAGWRGLPNGLAYGPTKAALTHLAEALYMDLQDQGIGVSVINPGFVATALTAQNPFSMPALIAPTEAARQILRGWARGQFDIHFPKRFTLWLRLMRVLPYRWYFALVRRFTGL